MKAFFFVQTRIRVASCLAAAILATTLSWAQVDPVKIVGLASQAHGLSLGPDSGPPVKTGDWRREGTITLFKSDRSEQSFPVVFLGKDDGRTQRIVYQEGGEIRQGSDGTRGWHSIAGQFMSRPAGTAVAQIESRTNRSVQSLFQHQSLGLDLEYQWTEDGRYAIDTLQGRTRTRYLIDESTHLVMALEFEFGTARDPFQGREFPRTHRVEFGDYRRIQGVMTPFRTAYRIDGVRVEEIVLDSAAYNVSLRDSAFTP